MAEISFRVHWPSTYVRDTRLSSWISNYAAFSEMHIRTILRIPWIRGTYNMSHGRVSTLFPPPTLSYPSPVRYPASPFFETACPSRASEGVSLAVSRSSSFACVFLQHEVLVSRPQLFLPSPPAPQIGRAKSLWSACRINVAFYEHSRSRDNIFEIYYLREKLYLRHCATMFLYDTFGIGH